MPIPLDDSLANSLMSCGIIEENLLGVIIVVLTRFDCFNEREIDPRVCLLPSEIETKYPFVYFRIDK